MSDEMDISELFKGSSLPIDDLVIESDPEQAAIESLYQQAVRTAEGQGWPAPEWAEFQERYKQEITRSKKN